MTTPSQDYAPSGDGEARSRSLLARSLLGRVRNFRPQDYAIVFVTVAVFIALSFVSPAFATPQNLLNLADINAPVALIACGETFVIISGNIDLSVASMYALTGIVAAAVTNGSSSASIGALAAIGAGLGLGMGNGIAVVLGRAHSLIVTLATQFVYAGLAVIVSGGAIISVTVRGFTTIGQGRGLGINYSVWILLGVIAVTWFALSRTVGGRHIYAVGGSREAARLSGVRVRSVIIAAFALSGLLAALAGVLASSRVGTAQASTGAGLALAAIAATILGGTSIFGGEGAIWRTALGVLLIALIANGFNLLGLSTIYQEIVEGLLILVAVAFDAYTRHP